MKKIIILHIILFWFNGAKSQEQNSAFSNAVESITSDDLKRIVFTLASSEMGGRGVGSEGIIRASDFIVKSFKKDKIGFIPNLRGYFQKIDYKIFQGEKPILIIGDRICADNEDYIGIPTAISGDVPFDIIYLRNTSKEYLQNIDLKDKTILLLTSNIYFDKKTLYDLLIKKGCRAVLLCDPNKNIEFKKLGRIYAATNGKQKDKRKRLLFGRVTRADSLLGNLKYKNYLISTLVVSPEIASGITGVKNLANYNTDSVASKLMPVALLAQQKVIFNTFESNNVLGFIEGNELKDEVVVISAHYDHLGMNGVKIMYGADDNASGVAAVMEIAEAYSTAVKNGFRPKRSIVFAAFTAEESGLIGSKFFVKRADSLKLKTAVDLNADMIGRGEDTHKEKNSTVKKLYVIATKKDSLLFNRLNAMHMGKDSLNLNYSLVGDFRALSFSDHASFIAKGIPAVMFFRGEHSEYHTEYDTPEKLDYQTMEKVTKLIFKLSWEYVMDD
ncbi:MAG: M20/M25/M40 family metallo-hydrolase [Bacteroidales bacterium]|nr:M20/M25/M40 family metallo-hydrolase [Bacteroidales bacterium]